MEVIRQDSHPHHELELKSYTKSYTCDGCKEFGFGSRFRCEQCNFDLHKECTHADQTTRHEFFKTPLSNSFLNLLVAMKDTAMHVVEKWVVLCITVKKGDGICIHVAIAFQVSSNLIMSSSGFVARCYRCAYGAIRACSKKALFLHF
ncbi:hypothetical protein LWI28_003250 [Acer negundo]|uniref:Phorbol-ester/DAG-type domain-containing protein n=1 Tax=Acer negundo TaxID=4023 RepID=A0AAD5I908_ACENE|nr:hypothetical protein LWI28_003250 [Acer negundo]